MLKQLCISAGNIKNGTSETLRNETVVNTENVKPISEHVPKHLKPIKDDEFGHYLAGLIDAIGQFTNKQQLIIEFNSLDASLAYYIKKRVGFGRVKKVKNTFLLEIDAIKGLEKVINLINGKIRTENKLNQIINNILNHDNYVEFRKKISLHCNSNKDFKNHWLAGFSDAEAGFQIKELNWSKKDEVRLNFLIDQTPRALRAPGGGKDSILLLIKYFLGGNLSYNPFNEVYKYNSSSYGSAKNVINYFDYFHLLSSKQIIYLNWRKAYLIIQKRDHLNKDGFEKIIKLQNSINKLSDTTV